MLIRLLKMCLGTTTMLSNNVTGGIWSSNNNTVATIDQNGVVKGLSAGTAVIRYTVSTTCANWTENNNKGKPASKSNTYDAYLCEDPATGGYPAIILNSGLTSAQ